MSSMGMRFKMAMYFGGKQRFIERILELKRESEYQLSLIQKIRDSLSESRDLTADNNAELLDIEETLTREIKVFSAIVRNI